MRFYSQDRNARFLLLLANLVVCTLQVISAVRHPSTEHAFMSFCWGLITLLNFMSYWGTYWMLTPQGLLERKLLFMRRVIPYREIQDVSPCPTKDKERSSRLKITTLKITTLSGKPVLASPAEYGLFVSSLEQHVDPTVIHV
jgi:hypothetical protein